jgi:ATP-binding cassette subfamily C (CFTR/MRP) protein 2
VCKAPVIQHFSETISGSTTIRSFDEQSRFSGTNLKLTDAYCRPKFHIAGAMEWLCFRLDMLSSITFAVSLLFVISIPEGVIEPGNYFPSRIILTIFLARFKLLKELDFYLPNFLFSFLFIYLFLVSFFSEGIAGLAVTYGLNLNMLQMWVIWNICQLENKIISVERIFQYTCISSEPPLVIEQNQPDLSWPSHGEVDICDLQVLLVLSC